MNVLKQKLRIFRTNTRKHLLFLTDWDNVITKQTTMVNKLYKYNTTISVHLSVIGKNMHNPKKNLKGLPPLYGYKIIKWKNKLKIFSVFQNFRQPSKLIQGSQAQVCNEKILPDFSGFYMTSFKNSPWLLTHWLLDEVT